MADIIDLSEHDSPKFSLTPSIKYHQNSPDSYKIDRWQTKETQESIRYKDVRPKFIS